MRKYIYIILFLLSISGNALNLKNNSVFRSYDLNLKSLDNNLIKNDSIPFLKNITGLINKQSKDQDIEGSNNFFDINIGKSYTDFDYINSQGDSSLEFITGNTSFLDINYSFRIFNNFFIRSGIDYMSFKTASQDQVNQASYQWDSSYLGIGSGFYWRVFTFKKISFATQAKIGFANMTSGTQYSNLSNGSTSINNLKDNDDFQSDIYYSMGISINYKLSDRLIIGLTLSNLVNSNNGISVPNNWDRESLRQNSFNSGLKILLPIN